MNENWNPDYPLLTKWSWPQYHAGLDWSDWYVVYGRNRDSGLRVESNYDTILTRLQQLDKKNPTCVEETACGPGGSGLQVAHDSVWTCGWCETIMVHESCTELLKEANRLRDQLEDYPILDEYDLSDRESTVAQEMWEWYSLKHKVDMCRRHDISIFAARSKQYPSELHSTLCED